MPESTIAFSCDARYFPLAKGLALSILNAGYSKQQFELRFVDVGCTAEQLMWFSANGIGTSTVDSQLVADLYTSSEGYQRAQIIRSFLPLMFPASEAIIWLDSDTWIQDAQSLPLFCAMARLHPDKLFICPEWHYSYTDFNSQFVHFQIQTFAEFYRAMYDDEMVVKMAWRPMLNTGVFAMSSRSPIWEIWKQEMRKVYAKNYGDKTARIRHMAEQIALNVVAEQKKCAVPIDPILNYMCAWGLPYRDEHGIVRVALPPNTPVGVVHLSMWGLKRQTYFERGLLYDRGRYLTDAEHTQLLA